MKASDENKVIQAGNFIKSVSEYYRFKRLCEEIDNLGNNVIAVFDGYYYEIFKCVSDIEYFKALHARMICCNIGDKVVFL